jgi:hypothetical protein
MKFEDLPKELQDVWIQHLHKASPQYPGDQGYAQIVVSMLKEIVNLRKELTDAKSTDSVQKE